MAMRIRKGIALLAMCAAAECGLANSEDDVRPTPEEQLAAAGVSLSISSLTATLFNRSAEPELRYLSALALGRTKDRHVLDPLLAALNDPNTDVRTAAVAGLRYLAAPESVGKLRGVLMDDSSSGVRQTAISALERIGNDSAVAALTEVATVESTPQSLRVNALLSLGHIGLPASADALRPLTKHHDREIRTAAAIAFAVTRGDEAVPGLVGAIHDTSTPEWLRMRAVRALEAVVHKKFGFRAKYGRRDEHERDRALALIEVSKWWEANRSAYGE